MTLSVDIVLKGQNDAQTVTLDNLPHAPQAWTDADVRLVLQEMLRAMDRLQRPGEEERVIALRGISWIVNPFEEGGVVLAIEISAGAAIAGPFDIDKARLETMITRVLATPEPPTSTTIH
jgi:hypothetical protein